MNRIKKILLAALGEKRYLALLANSFQMLFRAGVPGRSYQDIYFLKRLIEPGFFCVDIGAHLGYYTLEMSRLAGPKGRVTAIEPMSQFNAALGKLIKKKGITNVQLLQVALGGEGDYVEMGIPRVDNMKKFAYARVMNTSTHLEYIESERVKNERGDQLFSGLPRLDFIKCDVEGLEVPVFGSMMQVLQKYHPVILCELGDRNDRIRLLEMLKPLGYATFLLTNGRLQPLDVFSDQKAVSHNHYFIPPMHQQRLSALIGG